MSQQKTFWWCQQRGVKLEDYNNNFVKLMMSSGDVELLSSSAKKIYEFVLTAKEPSDLLSQALNHLIKHSINSPEHFPFLLHRINWFQPPFTHYHQNFFKIFRIYKVTTPQSCRVIYNILIEGFFNHSSHQHALACLTGIFSQIADKKPLLAALNDNYPHKLCPLQVHQLYLKNLIELCKTFKTYRADFLQIIIENLANFDTEIMAADEWVHQPFPHDESIIELREHASKSELAHKLDVLLSEVMAYLKDLSNDQNILKEIFLVFQNKILPIKTTKTIQLIVFLVAEESKTRANTFVSFLLSNIFDEHKEQNWYRIFTQSNFYLFSYILRSKRISQGSILKTLGYLVDKLYQKLADIEEIEMDQRVNLKEIMQQRQFSLIVLQTIVLIKLGSENLQHWKYNEIYEELLRNCHKKLHYDYFFNDEILKKMGVVGKSQSNIRIKFSNKFLPSTLVNTSQFIDELMRIQRECTVPQEVKEQQVAPRKSHKGETPISYCSETVI